MAKIFIWYFGCNSENLTHKNRPLEIEILWTPLAKPNQRRSGGGRQDSNLSGAAPKHPAVVLQDQSPAWSAEYGTTILCRSPGTDVMILIIFSPKNLAKKLPFLTQNKAKFWKKLIITLVFKKNAIFFAENWGKSQKIVIITSTPSWRTQSCRTLWKRQIVERTYCRTCYK
jgi:hypothetical protein